MQFLRIKNIENYDPALTKPTRGKKKRNVTNFSFFFLFVQGEILSVFTIGHSLHKLYLYRKIKYDFMGFVASKKGKKDGVHDDAKQAFGLLFFSLLLARRKGHFRRSFNGRRLQSELF